MTTLNQHQAVISATKFTLGESFQAGADIKTYVTKDQRSAIIDLVCSMMNEGEAELSPEARSKFDTAQKLRTYVNGLVTNWFNKSKELNGGMKYEAKNPGSRIGSGDATLKALKALKANLEGNESTPADLIIKVEGKIAERINELKVVTKKTIEFNAEDLPSDIRELVSL
jgi:hypothetical protein